MYPWWTPKRKEEEKKNVTRDGGIPLKNKNTTVIRGV
jgi:hypothetical protein